MFIGREQELAELNRLYQQNRFQLFVLYGRRRVGKTTLLKEFCKNKDNIFFSAEQSNNKLNLDKFSIMVFTHYKETTLQPFSTWEHALQYIHEKQAKQPLVLVFDEFPYLADIQPSLLSVLQHLIDHILKNGKLFLVLCGSYMGFMEKEVLGSKSPLFGRRTAQLQMKHFDYKTCISFLDGFSKEEQMMLYGALGGTAMYLEQIQSEQSLAENIQNLFLKPTGYLYEEPLLLLRQEVQEVGIYCAIIEAIAGGATKANEIATKTGEPSAKCLKYIKTLRELGIITKETPFGEKESSRKTIYAVSDWMFRFWYRYVSGNKSLLEMGGHEVIWERKIAPDYSHYMGLVFEQICKEYLLMENRKGRLPFLFTSIGRWWGTDPKSRQQVEIDLVAKDGNTYLFGECKWRNEPVDTGILEQLKEKADVMCKSRDETYYALFSKSGFTESLRKQASKHLILVSLDALLE